MSAFTRQEALDIVRECVNLMKSIQLLMEMAQDSLDDSIDRPTRLGVVERIDARKIKPQTSTDGA